MRQWNFNTIKTMSMSKSVFWYSQTQENFDVILFSRTWIESQFHKVDQMPMQAASDQVSICIKCWHMEIKNQTKPNKTSI
jgi:hypothetical protein